VSVLYVSEITRRKYRSKAPVSIRGPEDIYRLRRKLRGYKREHFETLLLNARHQIMEIHTVSIGTLNASLVHPRKSLSRQSSTRLRPSSCCTTTLRETLRHRKKTSS